MGRASSSKKVSRAARAAGRPGASRNLLWPVSIAVVVALGIGLIWASLPEDKELVAPLINDHWHAAVGIDLCGEFQPDLADAKQDTSGIHSHGDGLIHIHPFSSRYTGKGANVGAWADQVGLDLSDDSIKLPGRETLENGDDCGGKPGVVQMKVWEDLADTQGRTIDGDFTDFAPQDGNILTIAFLPEGDEIPRPPSAGAAPTDVGEPVPTGPTDGSTTTVPPASTDTTVAPEGSTETTAPPATEAPTTTVAPE